MGSDTAASTGSPQLPSLKSVVCCSHVILTANLNSTAKPQIWDEELICGKECSVMA